MRITEQRITDLRIRVARTPEASQAQIRAAIAAQAQTLAVAAQATTLVVQATSPVAATTKQWMSIELRTNNKEGGKL